MENKLNISWGTRIVILYLSFVAGIVFLVYKSMHQEVDLVSKDYYEREIKYQEIIDAKANVLALPEPIITEVKEDAVFIKLPETFKNKEIIGTIYFYRPSNSSLDFKTALKTNEQLVQSLKKSLLQFGLYKMEIDFDADGKRYFIEKTIVI